MAQIRTLFDPAKDIYRTIEKVITYTASQETRLRSEIDEYIVTDSIEDQLERLLGSMDRAMEYGGENEIGVWVSGFYGSGKSSFTKYLGLALDNTIVVGGVPFLKRLQDRLSRPTTKALLGTVARKFPAAVILLDLASEMLAGATMEEVSTVLYYKVLQWAGYSQNLKVAALERYAKKDGRYDEFTALVTEAAGVTWAEIRNDALVIDSLIPEIAHQLYPALFKTPGSFNTEASDIVRFETDRVAEMLAIVREHSGKDYVVFVVDEVGQYVGARQNLILNLDGLAKNLKQIGNGRVWIMATAQQTLTEDDPHAALNSPELYKLKDRFPIQINLEASDIREICYRRLLGKSPTGEQQLGSLFDQHGQALRHNTRLQNAGAYDSDFDRQTFINLYPFLSSHFDILLHLLGALARSTGGIGLRSAIKVIQDVLVEGSGRQEPVANHAIGWLATTTTLYDALEPDIQRAFPAIHKSVGKVAIRFPDAPVHHAVAKTVAILQILNNMPVTPHNIAGLLHPTVSAPSQRDAVDAAIQEMIADGFVPFGEKDGNLCFFSEKLNDIDQERAQLPLRTMDTRRIQNEALGSTFSPLPATRLNGSLSVTAGLKAAGGNMVVNINGERETIQLQVEFVPPADYAAYRTRLIDESRQHAARHTIYLLGRTDPQVDELLAEIYRSRTIAERYRTDPDQEIKEYCTGQLDRARRLEVELQRLLKNALGRGSFIFQGQTTAADTLDPDIREAARKLLTQVAAQVYDRYAEAPVRAETALAEKFLRVQNLRAITSALDPLGLVKVSAGTPTIDIEHRALRSIRDHLNSRGTVEGKSLAAHFTAAPYGWSQDTLRYLVAALLVAGQVELKISGRTVTVRGQQAIEALRNNNAFKPIGIRPREIRTSPADLARAAGRLTELTGDQVIPLEDEISKTATKHFPDFQRRYGPLAEKLRNIGVPGAERIDDLNRSLADLLTTDASDVPQRLGAENASLYEQLQWAREVDAAFQRGLDQTIRRLRTAAREIRALPSTGVPGQLQQDLSEELQQLDQRLAQDTFYDHAADFNTRLTRIEFHVREAAVQIAAGQQDAIREAQATLQRLPDWAELLQDQQQDLLGQLERHTLTTTMDLAGIKAFVNHEYILQAELARLTRQVAKLAHERRMARLAAESGQGNEPIRRTFRVPSRIENQAQMARLIGELQRLRAELEVHQDIEITVEIDPTP